MPASMVGSAMLRRTTSIVAWRIRAATAATMLHVPVILKTPGLCAAAWELLLDGRAWAFQGRKVCEAPVRHWRRATISALRRGVKPLRWNGCRLISRGKAWNRAFEGPMRVDSLPMASFVTMPVAARARP